MLSDLSIKNFTEELASVNPVPGGGSVSALGGALAASLFEMAIRITFNNEDSAKEYIDFYSDIREKTTVLIDEDSKAFQEVMLAYALPKITDEDKKERKAKIREALKNATLTPLKSAQLSMAMLHSTAEVAAICKESCLSDAATAFKYAMASYRGAMYNVMINLNSMKDQEFIDKIKAECAEMEKWYDENIPNLELLFKERLG